MIKILERVNFTCTGSGDCCSAYAVKRHHDEIWDPALAYQDKPDQLAQIDGHCAQFWKRKCILYSVRPASCRTFPYEVIETPTGTVLGLRPECQCVFDSAGDSKSQPYWQNPNALEALHLTNEHKAGVQLGSRVAVAKGVEIEWAQYELLEAELLRMIGVGPTIMFERLALVLRDLPFLFYTPEPMRLALARSKLREPGPTEGLVPTGGTSWWVQKLAMKLWIWNKILVRSKDLSTGALDLYARCQMMQSGKHPIEISRLMSVETEAAKTRRAYAENFASLIPATSTPAPTPA